MSIRLINSYIEMVINNEKDQRASGTWQIPVFVTGLEPLAIKVNLNISFSCKKNVFKFSRSIRQNSAK